MSKKSYSYKEMRKLKKDVTDWFCGDGFPTYSTAKAKKALEKYVQARIQNYHNRVMNKLLGEY